jgi:hypothetical protein
MPAIHQRKVIRDAVLAALNGATAAGTRVASNRKWPWKTRQLPALSIYIPVDDVDVKESSPTAPRELQRKAPVVIEAQVLQGDHASVDDALDALALEVEQAMHRDETFGGACGGSILRRTEQDFKEDGEETVGWMAIAYEVSFQTLAPYPEDGVLDRLQTADITTDIAGDQEQAAQARDVVSNMYPE